MAGMLEYKCPCCDGAIQFDSATQKMKCPYCDTEFDVDTLKGYDEELKDEKPSEMNWATPRRQLGRRGDRRSAYLQLQELRRRDRGR